MKKRKFLVSDGDGTLVVLTLLLFLIEALVKNQIGKFTPAIYDEWKKEHQDYLNHKGSYDSYINKVVEVFLKTIAGVKKSELEFCARVAVCTHKDQVHPHMLEELKFYKDNGYFLILLSHSPAAIVEIFAKEMGFDAWVGTDYLSSNGIYTGQAISYNKGEKLRKLIVQRNLTTEGSVAFGDTEADIPMLELVDMPTCINPNYALWVEAIKRGWRVITIHRDVVVVFLDGRALGAEVYQQKTGP